MGGNDVPSEFPEFPENRDVPSDTPFDVARVASIVTDYRPRPRRLLSLLSHVIESS